MVSLFMDRVHGATPKHQSDDFLVSRVMIFHDGQRKPKSGVLGKGVGREKE